MVISLSNSQLARLEVCRLAFNKFTEEHYTLEKFLSHCIEQSILDNEASAEAAALFNRDVEIIVSMGGLNVH